MADKKKQESGSEAARTRLAGTGRNEPCPCGSTKKYKRCHLQEDEAATAPPQGPPDPQELVAAAWRLFEQRRPGAAEKQFKAALALDATLTEARVGIGMARLQTGDHDGARTELGEAIKMSQTIAAALEKKGVKDAFNDKAAQPYLRASHALGCLAYDQERYDEALEALRRVFAIDEGAVGTEARLITAKTLVKVGRPAEAIPVLEPAVASEAGGARAELGLTLAHLKAGNRAVAEQALGRALLANPQFGKALLGHVRARVDSPVGAAPGSREEAVVYAQTYGDVWDDDAKQFLREALAARAGKGVTPEASPPATP